jgi:hypothetical protein
MHFLLKAAVLITTTFFLLNSISHAENQDTYFDALEKINVAHDNEKAIPPCSDEEKIELIRMLKLSDDKKLNAYAIDRGLVINQYGEMVEIYKGDFSNEKVTQYALITTSGTMRNNDVMILEKQDKHLIKRNLDATIIDNLIPNGEMSDFYTHVGKPYAFIKNGKTYIRYMNIPYKEYDIAQLQLCTYLWEGNVITLTGPNWTFDKKSGKMVPYTHCISSQSDSASYSPS